MAHWHGLAKLRAHTDPSLEIMDDVTISLAKSFKEFKEYTCSAFLTFELKREANARSRRQGKAKKTSGKRRPAVSAPAMPAVAPASASATPLPLPVTPAFAPLPPPATQANPCAQATHSFPFLSPTAAAPPSSLAGPAPSILGAAIPKSTSSQVCPPTPLFAGSPSGQPTSTQPESLQVETATGSSKGGPTPLSAESSSSRLTSTIQPNTPRVETASGDSPERGARKAKALNFNTYKFHASGDVTSAIRMYGTTDSYSTEPV